MKKFLKIFAVLALVFGVVVVGVFFYVTSSGFLRKNVLPKVSEAAGMSIDAETIKLSVFRQLELHNVTIGGEAEPADVKMRLVRVRYAVLPLLKQKLRVSEVTVIGENGTRAPAKSGDTSTHDGLLHVRNVTVTGLSGRYTVAAEGAPPTVVQFQDLSVSVPDLRDGGEFTAVVKGKVHAVNDQLDARADAIDVKVEGTLGADLQPGTVTVVGTVSDLTGHVGTVDLSGRSVRIDAKARREGDSYQVEELAVRELAGETEEAVLTVLGSVNPLTMDADLVIAADLPNAGLLNLAGGLAGGYGFGETRLKYDGKVTMSDSGSKLQSQGKLTIGNLTVVSTTQELPALTPMDVQCEHRITFDQSAGRLDAQTLEARVSAGGVDIVTLRLDQPTTITLGDSGAGVNASPASLSLRIDELDLGLFTSLIPPNEAVRLLGGKLSNTVDITIADAGKVISARGSTWLHDVAISANGKTIKDLALRKEFDLVVKDLAEITINSQQTTVLPDGKTEAIRFSFAEPARLMLAPELGFPDDAPGKLRLQIDGLDLALVKPFVDSEGFELVAGKVAGDLALQVTGATKRLAVKGEIGVRGLHVKASGQEFANLDITESLDVVCENLTKVNLVSDIVRISHAAGGGAPADIAVLTAKGAIELESMAGRFDIRLMPTTRDTFAFLKPFLGDIDLAETAVCYEGTVALAKDTVTSTGTLDVANLTAASKELELAPIVPLQIQCKHEVSYGMADSVLKLAKATMAVRDPQRQVLAAAVSAPVSLALADETLKLPAVPATVRISDFDLALVKPLVPADTGLQELAGTLAGKIDATVVDDGKTVQTKTELRLTGLAFDLKETGRLLPVDVGLAAAASYVTSGLATLESGTVTLRQGAAELAKLAIAGSADLAGEKLVAEVAVSSVSPMDLGRLEALFIPAGTPDGQTPAPMLRDLIAKDLVAHVSIDGDTIKLTETSMNLAGGEVKVEADLDLKDPEKPSYKGTATVKEMPVAPYMKAFAPRSPISLAGGLKLLAVQFDGDGFETEQILQQLLANAQVDVSRLAVQSMDGLTGALVQQLLVSSFDMSLADLDFKGGGGRVSYDRGMLHIPNFTLTSDDFRISGGGSARIVPSFLPALNIVPSFRGAAAEKLLVKGIRLTEGADGFFTAPAIRLDTPLDSKTGILAMAVDYGVQIGKVDPKYKQISDGLNILKSLGGKGGAGEATGEVAQPPKADKLIKGVFDILQPPQPKAPEQPAEQTTPKDDKDAAKRDAVNTLIRGFLK